MKKDLGAVSPLLFEIGGIVVTIISIIVTVISILQNETDRKSKHQKKQPPKPRVGCNFD